MVRSTCRGLGSSLVLAVLLVASMTIDSLALFGRGKKEDSSNSGAPNGEFVILSGGPALRQWEDLRKKPDQHDRWWGNFIRPARARFQELQKQHGKDVQIAWLVYRAGYVTRASENREPLISWIESVRDKYGVRLIWIDSGDDVIDYINRGNNRRRNKIVGFEYYGHSNRHAFMMDYSNDVMGASSSWLHERDLRDIRRSAFSRDAVCRSYGCHTGESMSQVWRAEIGVKLWGAKGKTDYANPLKPVISPGGYWKF